jgi:hypothetical protein
MVTITMDEQQLLLKITKFCMEEVEDVGFSNLNLFTREDYIAMAFLRGKITGRSVDLIREDIDWVFDEEQQHD